MAARTLEQVLSSLDSVYNPMIESVRQKQALVPGQVEADVQEATAAKDTAFDEILGGARRRGLGFAGIPLGEQAKYASNVFAPTVLRAKNSGREKALSLEDAILGIQERRTGQAQSIYDAEKNFFEQQRQFNESMAFQREQEAARQRLAQAEARRAAASRVMPSPSFGSTGGGGGSAAGASIARKQDGGFAFADAGGQSVSAAKYAQLTGQDIRDVLYQMGQAGDSYSKQLYNQLANDRMFGSGNAKYDQQIFKTYSPIFWGTY